MTADDSPSRSHQRLLSKHSECPVRPRLKQACLNAAADFASIPVELLLPSTPSVFFFFCLFNFISLFRVKQLQWMYRIDVRVFTAASQSSETFFPLLLTSKYTNCWSERKSCLLQIISAFLFSSSRDDRCLTLLNAHQSLPSPPAPTWLWLRLASVQPPYPYIQTLIPTNVPW